MCGVVERDVMLCARACVRVCVWVLQMLAHCDVFLKKPLPPTGNPSKLTERATFSDRRNSRGGYNRNSSVSAVATSGGEFSGSHDADRCYDDDAAEEGGDDVTVQEQQLMWIHDSEDMSEEAMLQQVRAWHLTAAWHY
jgi:hypothetical protein